MITVYLAGKFRGKDAYEVYRNVQAAEAHWYELLKEADKRGILGTFTFLCPHSMSIHFDRTFTDDYWLKATLEILHRCDAVFLLPGWEQSEGARGEKAEAEARGIPVFTTAEQLMDWTWPGPIGWPR